MLSGFITQMNDRVINAPVMLAEIQAALQVGNLDVYCCLKCSKQPGICHTFQ